MNSPSQEPAIADGDFPAVTDAVRSGLADLLARLEKAEGPDRELDEAITVAVFGALRVVDGVAIWERAGSPVPPFTGAFDTAWAMVRQKLPGWGADIEMGDPTRGPPELRKPCVELKPHMTNDDGWAVGRDARAPTRAATLALAICCALVKALIARDGAVVSATKGRRVTTKSEAA